jgi:membrane associated rhomboid family serine protease
MFRNLPPVCKALILALVVVGILSLILPGLVIIGLPLSAQAVLHHVQLWRLITYPFFFVASGRTLISSIISLAWIGMLIAFFGGELETIIHSNRFAIAIASTIVVGGIIFMLFSPAGTLAGPSMITMFVLGGFAYMWPKREISIFGLFWIKAWIIALVLFVVSVIPMSGLNLDTSATNLFGPIFGAFGAIVYLHFTYRQYNFGKSIMSRFDTQRSKRDATFDPGDPNSIQLRIDAILDKIGTSGMQSLSKEERAFLLTHSK